MTERAPIPLPVRILGGPVLVFLLLFAMKSYLGSLSEEPVITAAAVAVVVLAWLRVVWPAGFRRRSTRP